VAEVPSLDLVAGEHERMRYFLIGADEHAEAPKAGFKLLLVLPGGDGGADFNPFVRRIWKGALDETYLVAQLVAPQWSEDQGETLVWPTEKNPWPDAGFTTEEFIDGVIADVEERHELDLDHVFTLSWSSGGPAAYAYSLSDDSRCTGSFIAMSVFKPDQLPSLKAARREAYYLLHSPEDFIPIEMAREAEQALEKKGAEVKLVEYAGGHGWHGNVYGMISDGVDWLERNHAKAKKKPKR
jgi:predicted esterase